ncbi:MAG: class I SAM-dependent methyltransferase [Arthrobacter sp.]|nr:class I SAM-dependent methyltransferase [Arthrobacter sp.]
MMRGDEAPTDGDAVAASYDAVAGLYIDLFGDEDRADPEDRDAITAWALACDGPVLDAGCGPGHWTAALARRGVEAAGVDLSAEFLEHARRRHPALSFQQADLRRLPSEDGEWAGVLAWFSLIHLQPTEVTSVLGEFHRVLVPGGRVLLGFFTGEGEEPRSFAHQVAPAWAWPPAWVERELVTAGFSPVVSRPRDATATQRAQGHWEAIRVP